MAGVEKKEGDIREKRGVDKMPQAGAAARSRVAAGLCAVESLPRRRSRGEARPRTSQKIHQILGERFGGMGGDVARLCATKENREAILGRHGLGSEVPGAGPSSALGEPLRKPRFRGRGSRGIKWKGERDYG